MRGNREGNVEENVLRYLRKSRSIDSKYLEYLDIVHSQINHNTKENQSVLIGKILMEKACKLNYTNVTRRVVTTPSGDKKSIKQYALDKFLCIIVKISQ